MGTEAASLSERTRRYWDKHCVDFYRDCGSDMDNFGLLFAIIQMAGERPRVLDLGCGPGRFAPAFELFELETYVGVDYSSSAIAEARRLYPDWDFRHGDMENLDECVTEEFDLILLHMSLGFVARDRAQQMLASIRTRLVPGGLLFIVTQYGDTDTVLTHEDSPHIPVGDVVALCHWNEDLLSPVLAESGYKVLGVDAEPIFSGTILVLAQSP